MTRLSDAKAFRKSVDGLDRTLDRISILLTQFKGDLYRQRVKAEIGEYESYVLQWRARQMLELAHETATYAFHMKQTYKAMAPEEP